MRSPRPTSAHLHAQRTATQSPSPSTARGCSSTSTPPMGPSWRPRRTASTTAATWPPTPGLPSRCAGRQRGLAPARRSPRLPRPQPSPCSPAHRAPAAQPATQMEVESYVVSNGYFIPDCHQSYWLGYKAQFWGKWLPLDANVPSTGNAAYKNFGRFPIQEPNGRRIPALCTIANSSQAALNTTYGWGDVDCDSGKYAYICRIIREPPAPPCAGLWALLSLPCMIGGMIRGCRISSAAAHIAGGSGCGPALNTAAAASQRPTSTTTTPPPRTPPTSSTPTPPTSGRRSPSATARAGTWSATAPMMSRWRWRGTSSRR